MAEDGVRVVRVDAPAGEVQAERAVGPGERGGAGAAAERGGVVAEHPSPFVAGERAERTVGHAGCEPLDPVHVSEQGSGEVPATPR